MAGTSLSDLRRRMLQKHGVDFDKHTRKPIITTPVTFIRTPKMQYLEQKYSVKMEVILFMGSLDEVVSFFNGEVDRSTISKWRKQLLLTPDN